MKHAKVTVDGRTWPLEHANATADELLRIIIKLRAFKELEDILEKARYN